MSSTSSQSDAERTGSWRTVVVFGLFSIVAHLVLLWIVAPVLEELESSDEPVDHQTQVEFSRESTTPDPPEPDEQPEPDAPDELEKLDRKSVTQKTNEESPEEADYLSEEANRVEKETRARETTEAQRKNESDRTEARERQRPEGEGSKSSSAPGSPSESDPETSSEQSEASASERSSAESAPESPPREESADRRVPSQPLPMPSAEAYAQAEPESSSDDRASGGGGGGAGHQMFEELEEEKGAVRAALDNHIPEIQPGNHTAVNARKSAVADYISTVHRDIHRLWGNSYLPSLDRQYGPGHPLSDTSLNTVLELVVDGETGEVSTINIVESSGEVRFDSQAVLTVRRVAPFPAPPRAAVSPDGRAYVHWNFWRDQRQCGTFGVSVFLREGGESEPVD